MGLVTEEVESIEDRLDPRTKEMEKVTKRRDTGTEGGILAHGTKRPGLQSWKRFSLQHLEGPRLSQCLDFRLLSFEKCVTIHFRCLKPNQVSNPFV